MLKNTADSPVSDPLPPADAVLLVDLQRDFCPGGALAVPSGDAVAPVWNAFFARRRPRQVYATRDWHPAASRHFQPAGRWPPHCIAGTPGAEFFPALRLPAGTAVISKGTGEDEDGYDGFAGHDAGGLPLEERLRRDGVRRLWVGGLATDYCVRATAASALRRGFEVVLLVPGCRGIDPQASRQALDELRQSGARLIEE